MSDSWSGTLKFDNAASTTSLDLSAANPMLVFLETVGTILAKTDDPFQTLVNWIRLVVDFCRPSQLHLILPLVVPGLASNSSGSLAFSLNELPYNGFWNYKLVANIFELKLSQTVQNQAAVATEIITLSLGEGASLNLSWLQNQPAAKNAEVQRIIALAAARLTDFVTASKLRHELEELRQAEALRVALLTQADHDLRGPFSSLVVATDLLLEKGLDLPATQVRMLLQRLKRNTLALDAMLSHYLAIPRLTSRRLNQNPTIQPLDVLPHLHKLSELISSQLERKEQTLALDFSLLAEKDLPLVLADPHYLDQVLLNLLYNAHKHTPEKTEIRIQLLQVDAYLQISVINTGATIAPTLLPQLEAFFNKRLANFSATPGILGLGLTLVQDLVQRQHGLAGFTTDSNNTVFWIKLLLAKQ